MLVVDLNENQQKFINSTNVKEVVTFSRSFFIFIGKNSLLLPYILSCFCFTHCVCECFFFFFF